MKQEKQANVRPMSGNLTGYVISGVYLGQYPTNMRFVDRILYGAGVSLDVYPRPSWAFGLAAEGALKVSANSWYSDIGGFLWSGSFTYNLSSTRKTIPYAKVSVGYATIRGSNHEFVRVAMGLFRFTASSTTTRFEVSGNYIESYNWHIGLQMGVGIPL